MISEDEFFDVCLKAQDMLAPLARYVDASWWGIHHISGDYGWVSSGEWDAVFRRLPFWSADAYILTGNDLTAGEVARVYNEGGFAALEREAVRSAAECDADGVYYTTVWCEECGAAESCSCFC